MHAALRTMVPFVIVLCCATAQGQEKQKITGWGEVVDPDRDCKIEEAKGVVSIAVPAGHHDLTYTEDYTKHNAPRIWQPVEGDFSLTVKVLAYPLPKGAESAGGNHAFVSSGLLLWQDERNYIRMERAAVAASEAPFLWIESFRDGATVFRNLLPLADKNTGLRVVRKGKTTQFWYTNGDQDEWTEAPVAESVADAVKLPEKLKVGVLAINSTKREHAPRLTELKLAVESDK